MFNPIKNLVAESRSQVLEAHLNANELSTEIARSVSLTTMVSSLIYAHCKEETAEVLSEVVISALGVGLNTFNVAPMTAARLLAVVAIINYTITDYDDEGMLILIEQLDRVYKELLQTEQLVNKLAAEQSERIAAQRGSVNHPYNIAINEGSAIGSYGLDRPEGNFASSMQDVVLAGNSNLLAQ